MGELEAKKLLKPIVKSWEMKTVEVRNRTPWIGFSVETRGLEIGHSFEDVERFEINKYYAEDIDTPVIVLTAKRGDDVCEIHIGFECAKKLEEFIVTNVLMDPKLYELVAEYCKIVGIDLRDFIVDAVRFDLYTRLDQLREVDFLRDKAENLLSKLEEVEQS